MYQVICYSLHQKEVISVNVFPTEQKAFRFVEHDSKNLYEEEICAGGALESEMNYTLEDNGAASVSSHNGEYEWTWEVKEIPAYQPKVFNLTVCCQAYYNTSIELPIDFTGSREDAIMYAKEHLDELPMGILEYVPGSDELDEENSDFE